MNRIPVLLSLALLLALLLPGRPPAIPPRDTLEPALQERLAAAVPDERIPVLVLLRERVDWELFYPHLTALDRRTRHEWVVRGLQETAARTQGPLLSFLHQEAGRGRAGQITPFWAANAIAVEATPAVLILLAQRPDVLYIYEDRLYPLKVAAGAPAAAAVPHAPEPGLLVIGADQLWERGWDGQGVLVATIDTGAYLPHPALASRWRGNEPGVEPSAAWFDYWGIDATPSDTVQCQSHGTHVMGTMLGDDGVGNQVGVAPGAQWIAARIFGPPGSGCSSSDSTKLAGWQWVLDPDGDPGTVDDFPHVVNRSGGERAPGGGGYCRPLPNATWDAILAVVAAGATVFFGAGNEGPAPESIISWASQAPSPILAFAVGNVDGSTLIIRNSSSRGPSPCDHVSIKPEVVAPGVNIRSSIIGGYGWMTGTSMATPHTSGAAALLWQAFHHASAEQIQYALLNGAMDLGPSGEDNTYGMGLVYLPDAYHWLFDLEPSTAAVTPTIVASGARLTYTVVLRSAGQVSGTARLQNTLPAEVAFVPGSLWASDGAYKYGHRLVAWNGTVGPTQPVTVTYAVTLTTDAFAGRPEIESNVLLDDGLAWITRSVTFLMANPPGISSAADN